MFEIREINCVKSFWINQVKISQIKLNDFLQYMNLWLWNVLFHENKRNM